MKQFFSLLLSSTLLTILPIDSIIYGNSCNTIKITMNHDGTVQFRFNYYKNNKFDKYVEHSDVHNVTVGDVIEIDVDKTYDKMIIEVCFSDELIGEVSLNLNEITTNKDLTFTIDDKEVSEVIDIECKYKESMEPIETNELRNHYVFKPINKYMLPRIIELDKLKIDIDQQYLTNGYNDCYLLLNHGLKGSDFKKSEEDFYKVPLVCNVIKGELTFALEKEYYYDFEKGVMSQKKTNKSTKINDIVLSKNDKLLSEAYLIIEKFGFYQQKFQLDLLLEEKPLFGKNGYYSIKKLS